MLPLHPRTKSYLKKDFSSKTFKIIDPIGYFDMLLLQANCSLVITDSGGVQKEAFFNKKYCITIRDETEWVELVGNGFNFLAKPVSTLSQLVNKVWGKPFNDNGQEFYGKGTAAQEIVSILIG